MRCPTCDNDAAENDTYCRNCGAALRSKPIRKIIGATLILLGVLIAIAIIIPNSVDYSKKGPDLAALSDLRNARITLEAHFAGHNRYPKTLGKGEEEPPFRPSSDIDFMYEKLKQGKYRMTFSHKKGEKEYMCSSDDSAIYWRYKKDQNAKWQPI